MSCARAPILANCSTGNMPSALASCTSPATNCLIPATRTMKNSSRLLETMAWNFSLSASGTVGSQASSSTRPLNSNHESSRLKNVPHSRSASATVDAVSLLDIRAFKRSIVWPPHAPMSCYIFEAFSCRAGLGSRRPGQDRQLDAKNLAEKRSFALHVPQFQVGWALHRQSQDGFIAGRRSTQVADRLCVTAIESVGHPQQRCQLAHLAGF